MSGISKSRRDRGRLPINISAGEMPVVVCGVIRYCRRKRDTRDSIEPLVDFFINFLNVCTALSASPLEAG